MLQNGCKAALVYETLYPTAFFDEWKIFMNTIHFN